jgi:hypothetical protein
MLLNAPARSRATTRYGNGQIHVGQQVIPRPIATLARPARPVAFGKNAACLLTCTQEKWHTSLNGRLTGIEVRERWESFGGKPNIFVQLGFPCLCNVRTTVQPIATVGGHLVTVAIEKERSPIVSRACALQPVAIDAGLDDVPGTGIQAA